MREGKGLLQNKGFVGRGLGGKREERAGEEESLETASGPRAQSRL